MINAINKKIESIAPVDEGSYPARVYQIVQMGNYPDYVGVLRNKVRIGYELPTELHVFDKEKGEQPRVVSEEYTLSFNEKANLRKVIDACDPKALKVDEDGFVEVYDVEKLMGKTCLVTIKHTKDKQKEGVVYANVGGVTVLPKGMTVADPINPQFILSYDNWDEEKFAKMPEFIQKRMMSSTEYQVMKGIITNRDDEEAF